MTDRYPKPSAATRQAFREALEEELLGRPPTETEVTEAIRAWDRPLRVVIRGARGGALRPVAAGGVPSES